MGDINSDALLVCIGIKRTGAVTAAFASRGGIANMTVKSNCGLADGPHSCITDQCITNDLSQTLMAPPLFKTACARMSPNGFRFSDGSRPQGKWMVIRCYDIDGDPPNRATLRPRRSSAIWWAIQSLRSTCRTSVIGPRQALIDHTGA